MGAGQRRGAATHIDPVVLPFRAALRGRLLRRYKRFLADIETEGGAKLTVHCPDPGSMRGLAREGAAVRCSSSDAPGRKLRHTLEMIRAGRIWVGVHTGRANPLVQRLLEASALPELRGYSQILSEVRVGDRRLDFALTGRRGDARTLYLEVKSVTLAEGRTALFPDSVTERGRRHVELLAELARKGRRAALLYVVQRADCDSVSPALAIDPAYASALERAARAGVELLAVGARVTARGIEAERRLPVHV